MLLNEQQIEEKVKVFIAEKSKFADLSVLNADTKVFSSGLLDSVNFIELVLFLENEFKIKFSPAAEVNMKNMDVIKQIVQMVIRHLT